MAERGDNSFNPFEWSLDMVGHSVDIVRIFWSTVFVFGAVWVLGRMGLPNATLLAWIIALGVLLWRMGYISGPSNMGRSVGVSVR